MQRVFVIMVAVIILLFIGPTSYCQSPTGNFQTTIIEPYPLKITTNKTTNLLFPSAIKSVDRGSVDILAQKAKGVENLLLVKAGRENFLETNLSVITADGKLYSFIIRYTNNPSEINISFIDTISAGSSNALKPSNDEVAFKTEAERILNDKKRIRGVNDYKYDVGVRLNGIYVKEDVIFFKIDVVNNSNINYDVDMLRFFIIDEKKSKRTATQEIEIHPLYANGLTSIVRGQSKNTIVFALPKFTIPDKKYLSIQLMEGNGGRHLSLRIFNRTIIKASRVCSL